MFWMSNDIKLMETYFKINFYYPNSKIISCIGCTIKVTMPLGFCATISTTCICLCLGLRVINAKFK